MTPLRRTGRREGDPVDFEIPPDIQSTLDALDAFIEREIKPLEQADDNIRFFDHRREYARTDFENGGVPRAGLGGRCSREMRRRADAAGWLRHALPGGVRRSRRDATSRWRSSASTSRRRASGCTTTCRTRARSSATSRPC